MRHVHSKLWLYSEIAILTFVVPFALIYLLTPRAILPAVWLLALYCHFIYRVLTRENRQDFWNLAAVNWANVKPILLRFALSAVLLGGAVWLIKPDLLFGFVRSNPAFWALVMLLYPVLSVVPQEIIFRSFFFTRYATLFSHERALVLVSGVAFGLAHIVFQNWVAPSLCVIGGIMFASTYARTRSLMLVALEHALYGDFVFTLGLGKYFYHGSIALSVAH